MIDLTQFETQCYDSEHNNCMHFAALVYEYIHNVSIFDAVQELCTSRTKRQVDPVKLRKFKPCHPHDGCIVSMKSPQIGDDEKHVGIYINGCIAHLTHAGMRYEPLHFIKKHYYALRYYNYEP